MTSILDVVGAQTFNSFSDGGAGTDHVSRYIPRNRFNSPITGGIGGGSQRPIMFRYIQIYNTSTSTGALDLQIATAASGSGGAQSSSIAGSDNDPDWNVTDSAAFGPLQFACMSTDSAGNPITYYYGLYKNDGSRVYFNTGASASSSWNPVNVYTNGTISTAYDGRVLGGRIGWYHVPNAPTSPVLVSNTSSSIALRWTHPTDDGITDSLPFGGLYGYTIARKVSGTAESTYQIFGAETSASPSGCDYIQGTSAYNYTTTPPVATPSSANVFTTTGAYQEVTGLASNTRYDFKIAGLNLVTDRHNAAAASIVSTSPTSGTRAYGNYTSVNVSGATSSIQNHVGTNLIVSDASYRTKLATPTVSGDYAATASVNQGYSSSVTFSQESGGGAVATTLTYSMTGTLPPGLSRTNNTIAGTPTAIGSYSVTVTATNDDGFSVSKSVTIVVKALGPKVSPTNGAAPTTRSTAKVWNGTSFVEAVVKVYDGTTPYNANGWKYLR
jgi:hypothetical protein